MHDKDRQYMEEAIKEAQKSLSEDERVHPKVGVVVTKDDQKLASGFRGELALGDHAEFTVLEKKLRNEIVAGATVYTTLEPCTTRGHTKEGEKKIPCAHRLIERRVGRVVIGILDPNRSIHGEGFRLLREAGIAVQFFPSDLMAQVEDQNREFIRYQKGLVALGKIDEGFVLANRERSLDSWYQVLNYIYWNRNFNMDVMAIFTHLVEVIGGLSLLASQKKKKGVLPESFITKAIAWWLTLCGKLGVKSVADMVWNKFPYVCAYCHCCPHDPDECSEKKAARHGPDWEALHRIGNANMIQRPISIGAWQRMFSTIYPAQQTEEYGQTFGRLTEELGELAESLRVFPAAPGYFLSEAADVFAWLMHIQNIIDQRKGTPKAERGIDLNTEFCKAYPDICLDCKARRCKCPPILEATIGRISHEVPAPTGPFELNGNFMTMDKVVALFQREVIHDE